MGDRSAHITHAEIQVPPAGATPEPTDPCAQVKAELHEIELALAQATDDIAQARLLCKQQINKWRAEKPPRAWSWIKYQPAAKAFYGPLSGS